MLNHIGTRIIETKRLKLRQFELKDSEPMFTNWASDPDVTKFITWETHENKDITAQIVEKWISMYADKKRYHWAICVNDTEEVIGSISVVGSSECNESCEVGYCIGKSFWNKGYTTEAMNHVLDYLINDVGFERVEALHQEDNSASGRVMSKAGMTYEGCKRNAYKNRDGVFRNLHVYSILKSELVS